MISYTQERLIYTHENSFTQTNEVHINMKNTYYSNHYLMK